MLGVKLDERQYCSTDRSQCCVIAVLEFCSSAPLDNVVAMLNHPDDQLLCLLPRTIEGHSPTPWRADPAPALDEPFFAPQAALPSGTGPGSLAGRVPVAATGSHSCSQFGGLIQSTGCMVKTSLEQQGCERVGAVGGHELRAKCLTTAWLSRNQLPLVRKPARWKARGPVNEQALASVAREDDCSW